jgi:chromosome segregation ATPase
MTSAIRKAAQNHTTTLRAQIETYEGQVNYWTERQADYEAKLAAGEKRLSGIRKNLNNAKQQLAEIEEALTNHT